MPPSIEGIELFLYQENCKLMLCNAIHLED